MWATISKDKQENRVGGKKKENRVGENVCLWNSEFSTVQIK